MNQVMGDGIMALFGAPLAHEDHAVRGCYAALRMQESVKRYAEGVRREQGVTIRIRVGLNSGEVVVRTIGSDLRMDYTAVGQTTHLAARMEQLADPGSILLTPNTLTLAEGFVEVTPLGPMAVKGLPAPVDTYELTGVSAVRSRLQAAATRGLSRFVGRDPEMAQIHHALDQARQGRGQVAAVVGEAGVGKSRLVFELTHSHRVEGWLALEAGSVSYGKATSYLPVIDLLKGYFRIGDRDTYRDIREKVTGKILTLDRTLEAAVPALLTLLDIPIEDPQWSALDPPQRRQRTLDALKRLLLREAQVQPLLVVFEDLHWIDSETQALLDSLIESLPTARLLLLVNYRPEYSHGWGGKTYYTQLRLDTLPPESAGKLLDAILGVDASLAPLKSLLSAKAGGNPLFLEESARTLIETRALVGERGAYRLTRSIETVQVPATVQAILASRIDRLPPEEKRLLETAAVIGKDFPFTLLQAIANEGEETLRRGLDHLQAAEFVYEATLFPDLEYTFKHALTHEVAYESLLHERRRDLHATIVERVERLYPDRLAEHVERLGLHAWKGELWDKAAMYLSRAGAKALEASANRQAVAAFGGALSALKHLPETTAATQREMDLRFYIGLSLFPLGELKSILDHLQKGEHLGRQLNDPRRLMNVQAFMGECLWLMGEPKRSLEVASRALDAAETLGTLPGLVGARFVLGHACHALGNYSEVVRLLRQNVESLVGDLLYRRLGNAGIASVLSRTWLAWSLGELGEFADGMRMAEEGLRIADVANHPFSQASAHLCVGVLCVLRGEYKRAVDALERAAELCRTWNISLYLPFIAGYLGSAYVASGNVTHAGAVLENATRAATSMGVLCGHALLIASQGEAQAGSDVERGVDLVSQALSLARQTHERGIEAWVLRVLGELCLRSKRTGDAETRYTEALSLADELRMRPLVAHCHAGLAKLSRRTGQRAETRMHWQTASAMYREMGMTYWLEKLERETGTAP